MLDQDEQIADHYVYLQGLRRIQLQDQPLQKENSKLVTLHTSSWIKFVRTQVPINMTMDKPGSWVIGAETDSNGGFRCATAGNRIPTRRVYIVWSTTGGGLDNRKSMTTEINLLKGRILNFRMSNAYCKWKGCPAPPTKATSMVALKGKIKVCSFTPNVALSGMIKVKTFSRLSTEIETYFWWVRMFKRVGNDGDWYWILLISWTKTSISNELAIVCQNLPRHRR